MPPLGPLFQCLGRPQRSLKRRFPQRAIFACDLPPVPLPMSALARRKSAVHTVTDSTSTVSTPEPAYGPMSSWLRTWPTVVPRLRSVPALSLHRDSAHNWERLGESVRQYADGAAGDVFAGHDRSLLRRPGRDRFDDFLTRGGAGIVRRHRRRMENQNPVSIAV